MRKINFSVKYVRQDKPVTEKRMDEDGVRKALQLHFFADVREASSRHGHARCVGRVQHLIRTVLVFDVAHGRVILMIFQAVEVLVSLAASVAAVGLVLLHSQSAGIWIVSLGIHYREGAIVIGR